MKVLKFASIFLLVTFLVFLVVVGLNWTAFKAVFSDREAFAEGTEWVEKTYSLAGLAEYIEAHPNHVSIVSLNIHEENDHLFFQEKQPRVLGALSNLFLLMEYSRQVHLDKVSPHEPVSVEELARFVVPGWYESGHRNAIRNLDVTNGKVTLDDTALIISKHFSQAASDWMFFHLGPDRVNTLIDSLGQGKIEPYIPGSGVQIAVIMREEGESIQDAVARLKTIPINERAELFTEYARLYVTDDAFRVEVNGRSGGLRDRLLSEERLIHSLWSRGEPLAFTAALRIVFEDRFVNPQVSAHVRSWLEWVGADNVVRQHTTYYAAQFESRLGYLSALDMGTSVYTGNSYIQTMFFDFLPVSFWLHMSSNYMNQDYQRRLIYDPEMRRLTELAARQKLTNTDNEDVDITHQ